MNALFQLSTSLKKRLLYSPAIRAMAGLVGATGVGQLAIFFTLPLLTRIYDPSAFGIYALISAFVGIASVGACLCLDLAIVQCRSSLMADELCAVAVLSTPITSIISAILLALIIYTNSFGYGVLPWWSVFLTAVMVGLNGLYLASRYRHLREQSYKVLARTTLIQNVGRAFAPLAWFLILPNWMGLTLGELTGRALGVRRLLLPLLQQLNHQSVWSDVRKWWRIVRRERRYTVVLLATVLLDSCASLLIAPLLAGAYGTSHAGEYFLAASMLVAPSALIGTAAADVLHTRSALLMQEAPEKLLNFLLSAAAILFFAGCSIYLPVYFFSSYIFPMLFGVEWILIVPIAQAMTPFMIVAFVASPCSRLLLVLDRTELKVVSDMFRLIGAPAMLAIATMNNLSFISGIWLLTWFLAAAYGFYFLLTLLAVHQLKSKLTTEN